MEKKTVKLADGIAQRFGMQDVSYNANMMDAESGYAFMISQLNYLETRMLETPYADIIFDQLVPIDTAPNSGAMGVNYFSYDGRGTAAFADVGATDLPTVSMDRQMHFAPFAYGGIAMEYTLDELRSCSMLGINLQDTQAKLCFRTAKELQQKTVLYGNAKLGMKGLFNNPLVPKATSEVDWADASADDIIGDINAALNKVWVDSKQQYLPNTILIDTERYLRLQNTRLSQYNDKTLLTYFKENNTYTSITGQKIDIRSLAQLTPAELKAAKVKNDNKARMVVYARDPLYMTAYMPIAPRFIAPQQVGLRIRTPMEFKISGTEIKYPNAMLYWEAK